MHALVRFAHVAAGHTFSTLELFGPTVEALGGSPIEYTLASLRYDLTKLRAKGLSFHTPGNTAYCHQDIRSALCF
jgi:hypothetical protein